MATTRSILLLDSDEQSAQDIQRFLKVSAYTFALSHASNLAEGLNYLKNRKPDLILLDAALTNQTDFAGFKQLVHKENIPSILLSDTGGSESQQLATQIGATDFLIKNKINLFHLQKIIANVLKLNETETKLDTKVSEFSARHEALYKVLNKMNSGVMVVNAQNIIRYANTKAYSILSEVGIRNYVAQHLNYRFTEDEEQIELKPKKNISVTIRVSNIDWNGERANLFLLDQTRTAEEVFAVNNEVFETLLNSLTENLLLVKDELIMQANKPALQILKLNQVAVRGKPLKDVLEGNNSPAQISVQSFLSGSQQEGVIKAAYGSEQPVIFSLKPLNLDGEFYQLLSFELQNKTENIPGARMEEEKFSSESVLHLASHDLREPVRTILNYVQLISQNLSSNKVEEAKEYAGFAQSAAARMEKLLSDLKTFIGLSEHPFQLQKVSMKLLLADVLKQLKGRIEECGAEVSFTELPDVSADRELVEKLLYHLIDNALKFRKKERKPVIDIGFDKFEGNIIFCVRDNGMGISKRYYQKIFELFEKLNRVDEYPGNGLGLAICKKITDLHGGEIWVESLPGSGSNFYFTLRGK